MTYINNNHVQHNNENRSRRSHSHNARRHSGNHFSENRRSRRSGRGGSSRRNHVRSQMSRMGHHQSQQLHTRRQGRHQQNQMNGLQFQNNNNNGLGSINQLLQSFGIGNGSIDQLLQGLGNGNGSLDQLLQGFGGNNGSLDQLLQGFGGNNGSLDQLLQGFGGGNTDIGFNTIQSLITSLTPRISESNFQNNLSESDLNSLLQQSTQDLQQSLDQTRDQLSELGLSSEQINGLLPQQGEGVTINNEVRDLNSLLNQMQEQEQSTSMFFQQVADMLGIPADDVAQLLNQTSNDSNPVSNMDNTDPAAEIQSLLQGFDMSEISSLLGMVSPDELSSLLQQESGMNVSADEITQLLQQLGLSTAADTNTVNNPMPVEPDNGIGDGADPIPTTPDTGNSDPLADIQSLLQGLDMGEIGSLLEMISPEDLAQMLQQESGLDVSATDIAQLLQQLGLDSGSNTSNDMVSNPDPVEPDNGIGDGASPLPTTTPDDSNTPSDVQSLLQAIDPDDISALLETISPEQLAEMLQQQSGLTVSAEDIANLLQQIQQDSNDTDTPSTPMPVEPDNGIGDGADPIPMMPDNGNTDPSAELQSLLSGLDMGEISSLLQMISPDDLAQMLQQESGLDVSADEIAQLLQQLGLDSGTNTSNDMVNNPIPVESDNGIGDGADPIPTMPSTTDSIDPMAEIQSLLQGIDMGELSSLLELISPNDLAQMLQQESGMNVSADDITQLLQQLGLTTGMDANNTIPAESHDDMSMNNSSDTTPATTTPVTTNNSNLSTDAQSLLQAIDPDDISLLLETISPEQLAEMLQQESGLTVSAEDIDQLLQQIQQDNGNTVSDTPIPVEPDNGIGDGAPDLGDLLAEATTTPAPVTAPQEPQQPAEMTTEPVTTNEPSQSAEVATATGEIQDLLKQLDTSLFSEFFDSFSAEQLASMLTQEGTNVSTEEVQALLSQIGLSA